MKTLTKFEVIKKYNLIKYNNDDNFIGKIDFELWRAKKENNGIQKIYTLTNQMSIDLDNGKTYFLNIETINNNNLVYDKFFNILRPKRTNKVLAIIDAN